MQQQTQMQKYQHSGWSFERTFDGSLAIITSEQKTVTIPKTEVQKLITFALSGDQNNQQVLESVKNLQDSYGSETSSVR